MKEKFEKGRKTGTKVLDAILCRSGSRQSPIGEGGSATPSTSSSGQSGHVESAEPHATSPTRSGSAAAAVHISFWLT